MGTLTAATSRPSPQSSFLRPAEAIDNHIYTTKDGCHACNSALHCNASRRHQLLSCDVMPLAAGGRPTPLCALLTVAPQRAQHDIQAQEEAAQVPGAGGPVAAGEAVRGRRDPDVDGGVCGACKPTRISSVRNFVPNIVAVRSPAHAGTDEILPATKALCVSDEPALCSKLAWKQNRCEYTCRTSPTMPRRHRMRRCLKVGIRMKTPDRMAPQMSEYVLQIHMHSKCQLVLQ